MTKIIMFFASSLIFFAASFGLAKSKANPEVVKKLRHECFSQENRGACADLAKILEESGDDAGRQAVAMKLCEGGDSTSCMTLGDAAKKSNALMDALNWYRKACLLKHQQGAACSEVAKIAASQKSEGNTRRWLKKACDQGHLESCKALENKKATE